MITSLTYLLTKRSPDCALVTNIPAVNNGHVSPPKGPGLGTELLPDLQERPDAHRIASKLEDL